MPNENEYDSGDAKSVRDRAKGAKRVDTQRRETLIAILSHENGRDWLYSVLERCGIYQTPFSTDALLMAHRVGEQNIGRELLAAIVAADSKAYMRMLEEQQEKEDGRSSSHNTSGNGADTSTYAEPDARTE